jgi:hypothetical protein
MHCEPERWNVIETRRLAASQRLTPEAVEAQLRQASLLRSQAIAESFRALVEGLRRRRRAEHRPLTLYARLSTWPQ